MNQPYAIPIQNIKNFRFELLQEKDLNSDEIENLFYDYFEDKPSFSNFLPYQHRLIFNHYGLYADYCDDLVETTQNGKQGVCNWLIINNRNNKIIGSCESFIESNDTIECFVDILIPFELRRKGYGQLIIPHFLDHLNEHFGITTFQVFIEYQNLIGMYVANKLGFDNPKEGHYGYHLTKHYGH